MKRAYLIEMTVLGDYVKRILGISLVVSACISLGMRTVVVVPGILVAMLFMVGAVASSVYDENNGWGLFRLTMPVSRRDVVLGRYGAIATLALAGMAVGAACALALGAVATVAPLPGNLAEGLALTPESLLAMALATAACLAIGALIAGVETPVYFRFGQTKAAQWLPVIIFALIFGSSFIIGSTGLLDGGMSFGGHIASLLEFASTPLGTAVCSGALVAFALVVLGVSALVSIKLYEGREL